MATLSIHFDPAVIARLTSASGDDTVHVTLSLGGGDSAAEAASVVPHGPLAGLMQAGLLESGTELTFHQRRANRSGRAVVTADGQLIVDGHSSTFPSPRRPPRPSRATSSTGGPCGRPATDPPSTSCAASSTPSRTAPVLCPSSHRAQHGAGAWSGSRCRVAGEGSGAVKRDEDIVPVELAEEEHEAILTAEILPAWTRDAVPQDRPVVVVVAGPAGSGKSHLCDLLLAVLNRRGGAVLIGRDLYKRAHPHYADLMRSDDRTAGVRTRPDVLRWQAEVEEYARSRRFDVVLEEPVADVEEACAKARSYRADGYRVELVALATAEAEAQLSSLDRYLTQVAEEGVGRYVSPGNFDRCARNLPRFLQVVEAERLAHQVMVARRGLQVLYLNKLTDEGAWQGYRPRPRR